MIYEIIDIEFGTDNGLTEYAIARTHDSHFMAYHGMKLYKTCKKYKKDNGFYYNAETKEAAGLHTNRGRIMKMNMLGESR